MALKFFWRCEGSPLSGTDDYSAGDTTASFVNSGSISATAARVGSNGLLKPASFAGGAQFSPASIYPGNVGSMAFSIYSVGSVTNTSGITIQRFLGTDTANYIDVQYRADGTTSATNLGVRMGRSGGTTITVPMTGDAFTPNAWFGVVVRWDIPNDLLRIELYNAAGDLVDSAENSGTDLSTSEPVECNGQFQCGAGRGTDAWATYVDNVFVADSYSEPLQNNLTITSYTNYVGSAGVTITNADDEVFEDGESITITGTGFGASQGAGLVRLCPTDNVNDASAVAQTVTAWSDTSITITVVRGSLNFLTGLYLFVRNNSSQSNSAGYSVQIEPKVYVRETLVDLSANLVANATGLRALIWRQEPTASVPNPNQVLDSLTTNGSGVTAWKINRGSLTSGDPIWLAILKDGVPYRATMRKITPSYE